MIAKEKYTEAYSLLLEIGTYEPAQEKLQNFFYAPKTVTEKRKYSSDADYRTDSITYTYNSMGNIIETSDDKVFTYDENGNILSGCDLIYGTYYTYTYKNGKLYQKKADDSTTTYHYNSKGFISKVIHKDNFDTREAVYEYTYHTNGKVQTLFDGTYKYIYNEEGVLTKLEMHSSSGVYATLTMTYGEYGITKMHLQDNWDGTAMYTYTYDQDGKQTNLEVKKYEKGTLDATYTYTFTDHQLFYSENPAVQDRVAIVCYFDIDAALDIVW